MSLLPLGQGLLGGGGVAGSGTGVVIETFEPDFPQIFTGETAELRMKIKNVGDVDATHAFIRILGIDVLIFQGSGPGCIFGLLLAPDRTKGTSGETQTCSVQFTAPTLPAGLTVQYTPIARLAYQYSTTTIKSLTFLPASELRQLQDSGRTIPAETVSSTAGPIAIDIATKGPLRFFENKEVIFPLEITVSNVGGGVACEQTTVNNECKDSKKWNIVKLKLDTDMSFVGNQGERCIDLVNDKPIQLFRGQSNTITCKVKASKLPDGPVQKLITVTATYDYFVEKSTTISVTGRD